MTIQLPTGFTARPATMADLQTAVDVMNAVTQADVGKSDNTPFTVGRYWQGDDLNLSTDTLLICAPHGQAAGFAQFIAETPPTPFDVDTWVHPAFVESGVGEALLQWIDQRAAQALITAPADVPASIEHVYVYVQNRAAQQRLEKLGYTRDRVFYRMAIEFDAPPPEPQLPEGITIRSFRLGEEDRAVYEAYEEAQADEWGHEWLPFDKWRYYFIEVEEDFDPEAWFLAVEGETIVGYALCRWDRAGEPDRSTVRYLAVRRPWRKRGVATALLCAAMHAFKAEGLQHAMLGVDTENLSGALRVYERVGFKPVKRFLQFEKKLA